MVPEPNSVLKVDLEAGYGARTMLSEVNFQMAAGERFGLVGASGAGKSTLVLALLGLLPWRRGWVRGQVMVDGSNLIAMKPDEARRLRGRVVSLVPQSPMSALNPAVSLRTHFEQAWLAHRSSLDAEFRARTAELLGRVHLPADASFLRSRPGAVSVGQAQRVTLALALLHRPALLVADEPTSALDPCTQDEILGLLAELNLRDGLAILLISHDLLSVIQFCQRIAVLAEGRIVECLAVEQLGRQEHHTVTAGLLRTLPVPVTSLHTLGQRWSGGEVTPQK